MEQHQLHDPGGPGEQHPAAPLPGAAAADHRRAGHGPGGPRRGPRRGPAPRPSRPARDQQDAADPRRSAAHDPEVHHRRPGGHRAAREPQGRRGEVGGGGGRDGHDHGLPREPTSSATSRCCRPRSTSCAPTWRGSARWPTSRCRCWPTSRPPRPTSTRFLARLGPFSDASRPAFRGLGKSSGGRARGRSRASDEEVAKLRELARNAPGLAKPLRQLLVTLDDRKRAVENDPRAKATAPPAPDKTAITGSGGFTGVRGPVGLLLLAGAGDQRPRRRGPRAEDHRHRGSRLHALLRDRRGRGGDLRALQPVPRPRPAGRDHARPGGRQRLGAPHRRARVAPRGRPRAASAVPTTPTRRCASCSSQLPGADDARAPQTPGARSRPSARRTDPDPGPGRPAPGLPPGAMRSNRADIAIVASPVLVGAVTVLVAIIAVFIAYNANAGLPFVPTYDLKAEVPNAAKLVEGNEVRLGGYRVGRGRQDHRPARGRGGRRALDRRAGDEARQDRGAAAGGHRDRDPAAVGARPEVRGAHARALEEDARDRRHGEAGHRRGGHRAAGGPRGRAVHVRRRDARGVARGPGGLRRPRWPGRGGSINEAIASLNPLLRELDAGDAATSTIPPPSWTGFFRGLGARGRRGGAGGARAGRAVHQHGRHLRRVLARPRRPCARRSTRARRPRSRPSARSACRRPFLADFADLSRRLRPAARELPRSLPPLNAALATGTPVSLRVPQLTDDLAGLFGELAGPGREPQHPARAARPRPDDRRGAPGRASSSRPTRRSATTRVYFFNPLGTHISQPGGGGTVERSPAQAGRPRAGQPAHGPQRLAPGRHAHAPGARSERAGRAAHPVRRAGRGRQRPRGLPGRPDGLPDRPPRRGRALRRPAGRPERGARPRHARTARRHLQVAPARHRQPRRTCPRPWRSSTASAATRATRGMSPFKAGLITILLLVVGSYFGFTKTNPFASPYKLDRRVRERQQHQARVSRCGSPGSRWARSPRSR